MNRTPLTPELLQTLYIQDGMSVAEVAAQTGYSPTGVRNALKAAGVPIRSRGGVSRSEALTADYLAQRYTQDAATVADIATEAGLSATTVLRAMRRGHVATDDTHRRKSKYTDILTRQYLTHLYTVQGASAARIATTVGCSTQTVLTALRRHQLGVRAQEVKPITREALITLYLANGSPAGLVADALGVSRGTLTTALVRNNLPTPSQMRRPLGSTGLTVRDAYRVLAQATLAGTADAGLLEAAWALAGR